MTTTHNTAAAAAVETLTPLLQEAAQAAQDKRQTALTQMDTSTVKQHLLDALAAAESKPDAAVLQQFVGMLPANRITKPNYLPAALMSLYGSRQLKESQAKAIAGALLAVARGELPAGLAIINDSWAAGLSVSQLSTLLGWLAPDALEQIKQDSSRAALDFASASYEIGRVKQMREALQLLALQPYKAQATVKIRNTTGQKLGARAAGERIEFTPGEPVTVERLQLAEAMGSVARLFDTGALEVLR